MCFRHRYLAAQRALALKGWWSTDDGSPLLELAEDGSVRVLPSRGDGGSWTKVAEDDYATTVEIDLSLHRYTPRGNYAGSEVRKVAGVVRGNALDGTITSAVLGEATAADLLLRKV